MFSRELIQHPRMGGKAQLFFFIISVVLYICDVGTDIYVAVQYYRNAEWWWFGLTLAFTIIPVTVINIVAFVQIKLVWQSVIMLPRLLNNEPDIDISLISLCALFLSCSLCSSILFRFHEEFMQWKTKYLVNQPCGQNYRSCTCEHCKSYLEQKRNSANSAHRLAWLRYIETVTESAPQWCLQVYIMLRQWYFPWYTVLSTVLSLLSLAWSITTLEKARQAKNENRNYTRMSKVVFLIWQLSFLVSRLSAIVYCAYILRYYVFIFIGTHWVLLFIALVMVQRLEFRIANTNIKQSFIRRLFSIFFFTYPLLFNVSEPLQYFYFINNLKRFNLIMNIVLAVHNILMLVVSLTVSVFDVSHEDIMKPIAIPCVLGGLMLGTFFCIVYYKMCPTTETNNDIGTIQERNIKVQRILEHRKNQAVAAVLRLDTAQGIGNT